MNAAAMLEVGDDSDPEMPRHLRRFRPFQAGGSLRPGRGLADLGLFRDICALGLWDMARRSGPDGLPPPDAILSRQPTARGGAIVYTAPLVGLTQAEAATLARLAGGRLPDEGEADRLLRGREAGIAGLPAGLPVWTASPWSAWSYRLVLPLDGMSGWYAPPDRILPDADPSGPLCLFAADPPVRRLPAAPGQTGGCIIVRDMPAAGAQ